MIRLKDEVSRIDPKMARVFLPWVLRHPRYLIEFKRLLGSYKRSVEVRKELEKNSELMVPPFMILSVTKRCNLKCVGCYAAAVGTLDNGYRYQMTRDEWRRIIVEGNELGVFSYIIAGGEPFLFPGLLDFCEEFKNNLFIIFTNGTAIKENDFKRLKSLKNVVIIVSLEGGLDETDGRRGKGVYDAAFATVSRLNKIGTINGISVVVNRLNVNYWSDPTNIDALIKKGVRIGFFIEYIPVNGEKDQPLMLTSIERAEFRKKILEYRETKKIYLIHSPGDEEILGGCASAGRGFVHVTPSGDLTPCPVSNIATHNLRRASLKEGLASPLFKKIRESEHLLETEGVPCALFARQEEVRALAKSVGAYMTN